MRKKRIYKITLSIRKKEKGSRNINDHIQNNWQNACKLRRTSMVFPTSKHALREASDLSELSSMYHIGQPQNGR